MKAIIFDMDGTLCDTVDLCTQSFRSALEPRINRPLSDAEIHSTFGPSEEGTIMAICPDDYDNALQAYFDHYLGNHDMCPSLFDGIMDIMKWLKSKGILIALVTGKGKISAEISLDYFGIRGYFDEMRYGSPDGGIKDKMMTDIINKRHLNTDDVIYIGDAVSDIASSHNAGIKIASVLWASDVDKQGVIDKNPDYLFETVKDLKSFLEENI